MSLDSIDVDGLERKDRAELATIAEALGGKPTSRTKKADIIAMIRYGLHPNEPGRPLEEIARPYWRIP